MAPDGKSRARPFCDKAQCTEPVADPFRDEATVAPGPLLPRYYMGNDLSEALSVFAFFSRMQEFQSARLAT
jgi:hypothetical protein